MSCPNILAPDALVLRNLITCRLLPGDNLKRVVLRNMRTILVSKDPYLPRRYGDEK